MTKLTRSVSLTCEQLDQIRWEFATLWARYTDLADDGAQPDLVPALREIASEHRAIVVAISGADDAEGTLQRALATVRWTPEERAKAYGRARARSEENQESGM